MDRSAVMRAVRAQNTKPELIVRKILRGFAPFYRLHRADLPGKPDIAYIGARRAIFVHGCFWHGHDCARGARRPKTNASYWEAKIARNQERDARTQAQLARIGWTSLIVWECELKNISALSDKLRVFVQS